MMTELRGSLEFASPAALATALDAAREAYDASNLDVPFDVVLEDQIRREPTTLAIAVEALRDERAAWRRVITTLVERASGGTIEVRAEGEELLETIEAGV